MRRPVAGSSNGRTPDSGSGSQGSSPCPAALQSPRVGGFLLAGRATRSPRGNVGATSDLVASADSMDDTPTQRFDRLTATVTALQFSRNYVRHELGPLGDQPFESFAHVGLR